MKTATDVLQDYKKLYDEGALTDSEYTYLKKHLLDMGNRQLEDLGGYDLTTGEKRRELKSNVTEKIILGVILVVFALIIVGCVNFIRDASSSTPDYTTYYDDENGNGEFDKGEWNWTEDEDGNVVDIDNDGSNF